MARVLRVAQPRRGSLSNSAHYHRRRVNTGSGDGYGAAVRASREEVDAVLPWLYLKGVSTGDMSEALAALVGKDAYSAQDDRRFRSKVTGDSGGT